MLLQQLLYLNRLQHASESRARKNTLRPATPVPSSDTRLKIRSKYRIAMEEGDLVSAPTAIPIRNRSLSSLPPPTKRQRPNLSHKTGRVVSMPNSYGRAPLLGNGDSGPDSRPFTPEMQSQLVSLSSLSPPPIASPKLLKQTVSLESVKEPDGMPFTFACPVALPAKVRFPLIDSPEPDSPQNNGAISPPLLLTNGDTADDYPSVFEYDTDEEVLAPVSENQSEKSAVVTGVVAGGEPGPIEQVSEQPKPQEAEIAETPSGSVPEAPGQNLKPAKRRDEHVKFLIGLFRKHEFENGCTTPAWLEKYPAIKEAAEEIANMAFPKEEKKEEKEESKEESIEEIKEDKKAKAKEECQAQGHQPTPPEPSPPQSSFNNGGSVSKRRKLVTRFFRKIKNFFKKSEPTSQVYEMAELSRVRTNVPKGKGRETVVASSAPRMRTSEAGTEEVENGYFVQIVPATVSRLSRVGYTEEKGETSAEGARKNRRSSNIQPLRLRRLSDSELNRSIDKL
ncbi:hypothetical protein F4805DRAFT_190446 [Annulohypoxylon moriforme]|nr:hypothetical protein F4805DRAFT_190446 [Annulohypoxylon moriforme]